MAYVVGVDVGGTKIAAALVSAGGQVSTRLQGQTPAREGGLAVAQTIISLIKQVIAATDSPETVQSIGIGTAGVVGVEGRNIAAATDAILGWAGTPLAQLVEEACQLPCTVLNDVHAHGLGEAWKGAGRQGNAEDSLLMLALGTGIGGAYIKGRQAQFGAHGVAGHFGHVPVGYQSKRVCSCSSKAVHLETIASGPGLHAWYLERGGNLEVRDAKEMEDRAAGGDGLALTCYRESATAVGEVLGGLVNCFDPTLVVVGGGLARAGQIWWEPMRVAYQKQLLPLTKNTPLQAPKLGSNSAIVGAARAAFNLLETR